MDESLGEVDEIGSKKSRKVKLIGEKRGQRGKNHRKDRSRTCLPEAWSWKTLRWAEQSERAANRNK